MRLSFSGKGRLSLVQYCICRRIQEEEFKERPQRCMLPSHSHSQNFCLLIDFQNVVKILWSLHHVMNVDRRRRFAFGVTIENTDTRIWFCCRQTVFVTRRFDFMKVSIRLLPLCTFADGHLLDL